MLHEVRVPRRCLSPRERRLLTAIAEAALPAGHTFPAADERAVRQVDHFLAGLPAALRQGYRAMLRAIEATALVNHRRPFRSLDAATQLGVLESWRTAGVGRRLALRALLSPLKVAHFDHPAFFEHIGCVYDFDTAKAEQKPRYMRERVLAAAEVDEQELECDVVVVGSGAGGAVVAKELAERGHAVILLEEGAHFERTEFTGRAFDMQRKMYRNAGATFSIGNVGIPIPIGKTVGGTTTINSGTCYRLPRRVMRKWRDEFGLTEFTEEHLGGYYERVESVIGVEPARAEHLGGVARVIARGCDALGYKHGPLRRNAPDCDGQGVCCFGCPTDAKRSTNVSYVPLAVRAGAMLLHGARVETILTRGDAATGVVARAVSPTGDASERQLTVRARVVVIACGSLMTPTLLANSGLCDGSGQLGRNLSIHPAVASLALFDETIAGYNAIPQGYSIEEFHDEGMLFEGASTPLDVGMAASSLFGPRLIEMAESYDRIAVFGFMVEDSSRGRVRTIRGRPVITYRLNDRDVSRLKRGTEILARVFFAAGARTVYPMVNGFDELTSEADVARFRAATLRASDFDLSAYHPLGTARMGVEPSTSVVGPTHESHDVRDLYIVDGSAVPSSLGVNPQVTIMAMATRAAEHIDRSLG